MAVVIAPYAEQHVPAVKAFNARLQAGGAPADYQFPESPISPWLPAVPGAPVYDEFFLALEGDVVRGTFAIKQQEFLIRGEVRKVAYYHHPFSEGIVDKGQALVGSQMLMHVMRKNPLLYALGMGGYDRPLPKMLIALKWNHCLIPFYFRVNHPSRFLRHMQALRGSPARRAVADVAAFSGAGWLGIKGYHLVKGRRGMGARADVEVVRGFGDWADELWRDCGPSYEMSAVRDANALNTLYPATNPRFTRVRVAVRGRVAGWAVVGVMHRPGHAQYGDLRVGTILDCLSRPEDATAITAAATRALMDRDVDLITSNQSHGAWTSALEHCGFLTGPSNFIFATSSKLSALIDPFDKTVPLSQWNRGDGDNLLQYV